MPTFSERIADARRILVVNPKGIGDVIHSLPVAALLKRSVPDAQIDFLGSSHAAALFDTVPFVSEVFSDALYPRPKTRLEQYRRRLRNAWGIRGRGYDAIVNLKPLDSTAGQVILSGARSKLAIRCMYARVKQRWLYDTVIDTRWRNQPCYRFLLESMAEAGFAIDGLHVGPGLLDLSAQALPAELEGRPYLHVSPFTSNVSRQLVPDETRRLLRALLEHYPRHTLAISCAAAPRELEELRTLLPPDAGERVQVYPGTLSLAQLAAVLAGADAHLGPDTGSLHLAWLAGARTVSWYLNHESLTGWVPYGPQHRVLLSLREQARCDGTPGTPKDNPMRAIKTPHIIDALDELLGAPLPPREQWWGSGEIGFRVVY
ncbi:MAG: glycosyltransferase family 9 protein [Solimonas sp.]